MSKILNIVVFEDEQRAGEKLIDLIKEFSPNSKITWKRSVVDGIAYLRENNDIDLIFSDIELIDDNVFKIYDTFQPKCPIIFCTAYDKFYVDAFSTNGIAYLLKPYTKDQFESAWHKYIQLFSEVNKTQNHIISGDLITKLKTLVENNEQNYKTKFSVKKHEGIILLKTNDISYFQAQGDFVLAIDSSGRKHILNYSLTAIENLINPKDFFRINRSEIVSVHSIKKFSVYSKNKIAISLDKPKATLYTSNSKTSNFRKWLENS
ncbi:LytR/AlgR family response regulator transcription factor [Aureibaculum conchae]|uniref:LytR/AlgR family response regulator transcription factor n=1 Tax=Aureibaculum sp. 2308TA14-22 TaxID=3108392 RepID=UPI003397F961